MSASLSPSLGRLGRQSALRRIRPTILAGATFAWTTLASLGCGTPSTDDSEISSLIAQLEGKHCRYSGDPYEVCVKRSRASSWMAGLLSRGGGGGRARCVTGAARCLAEKGPDAAEAVPALIHALLEGPNDFDTGDGVIPARSTIAGALAAIGDPRAIDALATALANAVPPDRGAGALVTDEPAARDAIIGALATFGPAAGDHWALVAAVLDERNLDDTFLEERRAQFDHARAADVVIDSIRTTSGKSSFTVPIVAVERALEALDRTSAEYRRKLEARSTDRLASVAADALGAFGRVEAIPTLTRALENPAVAAAAADALVRLDADSPPVVAALRAVWSSATHGPAARGTAARALGTAGDFDSAARFADGLADIDTCEPCAGALVALATARHAGHPSDVPALPAHSITALRDALSQPSLVVREPKRVIYSTEASRQVACKQRCIEALAAIGTPEARSTLDAFTDDPDIGRDVRRARRVVIVR